MNPAEPVIAIFISRNPFRTIVVILFHFRTIFWHLDLVLNLEPSVTHLNDKNRVLYDVGMPKNRWSFMSLLSPLFHVLNRKQKSRVVQLLFGQFVAGILEILGILMVGFISVTSLAILTNDSAPMYPEYLVWFFNSTSLESLSSKQLIILVSIIIVFFFAIKNLFMLWMNRYLQQYLSRIATEKSLLLFDLNFKKSTLETKFETRERATYATTEGSVYAIIGMLGSVITLAAESLGILMVLVILMIVNQYITLLLIFTFFVYALFMSKYFRIRASENSYVYRKNDESSKILFTDLTNIRRELYVSGKVPKYRKEFFQMREASSFSYGQMIYFQSIPRIALDFLVVLSVFLIASFAIMTSDIRGALTQILIFLAAISRLAPAALRMQQAKLMAISSQSLAGNFFELHEEKLQPVLQSKIVGSHFDLNPLNIVFENVSFKQPHSKNFILNGVNFTINQGDFVAIAGKSGAGKSTLCDLILGVLDPLNGKICINDTPSRDFIHANPGLISFVPQKVSLIHASFTENLTLSEDPYVSNEVLELVRKLNLEVFLSSSNQDRILKNFPFQGSGGEIQRIGIGRALITNPRILILDEPTSSQDNINLDLFYEIIDLLKSNNTTVIVAAHNLDIIKKADYVLYLNSDSKVVKQNYEKLKFSLPDFVQLTNKD